MSKKSTLLILMINLIVLSAKAQYTPFDSWGVGVNAGLYGLGVQGATTLSPHFKLRAGIDVLSYTDKEARELDVDVEYRNNEATAKAELTETKLSFPNFKALIDFYPMANSVFSITGGFYIGNNSISTNGLIHDYEGLSSEMGGKADLRFEDIVITPNSDGSFAGKLEMGNVVKPYFGIGLGRTIPRNRVGFRFELGVVYQGKYKLTSPNINETGRDWFDELTDELDLPFSKDVLKLWPMLNFSLTYRIK